MAHSALAQSTLLKSISVGTGSLHKTTTLSKHGSVSTPTKASIFTTTPCHAAAINACTSVSIGNQLTSSPNFTTLHAVLFKDMAVPCRLSGLFLALLLSTQSMQA